MIKVNIWSKIILPFDIVYMQAGQSSLSHLLSHKSEVINSKHKL